MSVVVFTNGCFDLIHPGHIDFLERARAFGDRLVVGLNSDESVTAIKGAGRPLLSADARAAVLRGLRSVDEVIVFNEPTPARLIEEIRPDVLIKGGDWPVEQIVGADSVLQRGGQVHSLPLLPSYSTSNIVDKIQHLNGHAAKSSRTEGQQQRDPLDEAEASLLEHQEVMSELLASGLPAINQCAVEITEALRQGKKLLVFGNGGSASDAQHIAAEFVGRFERERRAWPAIALTTDTSALTALSNDYGFEQVFSRQVEALAQARDVVIGISTSGNSPNVIAAIMSARKIGCRTIGLTGAKGKRLASLCDAAVLAPSTRTARIQEAHIAIGHIWCELADKWLEE
jgi:D-sedoheptulose 7-phosphate isomerase